MPASRPDDRTPPPGETQLVRSIKAIGFGVLACGGILYMFFFATAGSIQVIVLVGTVGMLLWFGTVHPGRLVNEHRRPHLRLFTLAALGLALLISAMLALSSGTMLVTLAVGLVAIGVGLVRAVRFGLSSAGPEVSQ